MTTAASAAYLTALIAESEQREQRYKTALASADTPHDQKAATGRLNDEQAQQQKLRKELAELPNEAAALAA